MEKSLFEQMDGTCLQEGDYLVPNLTPPEAALVGIWGQRRRKYLWEYHNPIYTALLLSGKLDTHLTEIDHGAKEMFSQFIKYMAEQENITEQLKANGQMEWVGRVNNIRDRVTELINAKLLSAGYSCWFIGFRWQDKTKFSESHYVCYPVVAIV